MKKHHVRDVLNEVFSADERCGVVIFIVSVVLAFLSASFWPFEHPEKSLVVVALVLAGSGFTLFTFRWFH